MNEGLIIFGQNLDLPAIVVHSRGVRHGRSEDHGGACVAAAAAVAASDDCISNQNVLATEHTASLRAAEINLTGFFLSCNLAPPSPAVGPL